MRLSDKKEFYYVDILRIFLAVLIVCIHVQPLLNINFNFNFFLTNIISSIAVPSFFIISGFFVQGKIDNNLCFKYIFNILKLYVLYSVLYLPNVIYQYYLTGKSFFHCVIVFFRDFLFVGELQFWYLLGLIYGVLLLFYLTKKLSDKKIFIISVIIYMFGLSLSLYFPIFSKNVIFNKMSGLYFKAFVTSTNGLFLGFPFLFWGYLISKYKNIIYKKNYFILFLISYILMIIECLFMVNLFNSNMLDMSIFLVPTVIFLFLFVLFKQKNNPDYNYQKIVRNNSVLLYTFHFEIYLILELIFGVNTNHLILFIFTLFINLIFSNFIIYLSNKEKFKFLKKIY